MANSIIEGNDIYERVILTKINNKKTFTIPEALNAINNTLIELDFCSIRGPIRKNIALFILNAIKKYITYC